MKYILGVILMIMLTGCVSTVTINTIKPWEGHYFSTNDFYNATKNIDLSENETIWVLSNTTLKQVLKQTGH